MKLIVCYALIASICAAAVFSFGADEVAYRLHINTKDAHAKPLTETLRSVGIDAVALAEGRVVEVFASANDLKYLTMNKYQYTVVEKAVPFKEKTGEDLLPNGYHDLDAINNILFSTQSKYPSIAKVVDVGREYGVGNTYEGRPMYALKISDNVQVDEDEPNLLFVSLHHSREIVTPEIILEFIRRLTEGYGTDNAIKAYVDSNEIFLAPVWNPDGLEYVWRTNNLWRKNRKPVSSTAFGVDQNRNYDLGWASSCGGSSIPSSETYRGPSANSEEETQNLIMFGRKRNFAKVIDFHSYGREVLVSYTCTPIPRNIADYNIAEGIALGKLIGYGYRVPSADGEHQQLAIKEWTTYAFLVETETEFQPSYQRAISEAERVWPLAKAVIEKPIPITGRVFDKNTGRPIVAKIEVREVEWKSGETRTTNAAYGRYYYFLPDGTYTFSFSAAGYQTVVVTVALSNFSSKTVDVPMTAL